MTATHHWEYDLASGYWLAIIGPSMREDERSGKPEETTREDAPGTTKTASEDVRRPPPRRSPPPPAV